MAELNLDDFYWEPSEVPDRVWEMQQLIMEGVRPSKLVGRLNGRFGRPWCWEGVREHCWHIAPDIFREELAAAMRRWKEIYQP